MKKLNLIHLGIGRVGKALVRQITKQREEVEKKYDVRLNYCGLFVSDKGLLNPKGLTLEQFIHFPQIWNVNNAYEAVVATPSPFILIDTTASEETYPLLLSALKKGEWVVLSNKKPISGSQKRFDLLHKFGGRKILYETTVGAALPVISTLRNLIATGDDIMEIKGCFSGTLGFLFSQLETGLMFSQAVAQAMKKGYTEPDPRDDLSGVDVARKALILARITGQKKELADVALASLYPKTMDKYNINHFLQKITQLDGLYTKKFREAKRKNKTLRFVATIAQAKSTVDLEAVNKASDLDSLAGPDNIIIFKTKRYFDYPLVIKGPGAGIEVTASGVFAEILTIVKMISFTT
ncbi:hypothetical protein FJY90_00705 [Candidatus Gottesmanbacteria bacterium]|nr:hypothetical protein [Candidatus Gottesmanbacteria bacterium]